MINCIHRKHGLDAINGKKNMYFKSEVYCPLTSSKCVVNVLHVSSYYSHSIFFKSVTSTCYRHFAGKSKFVLKASNVISSLSTAGWPKFTLNLYKRRILCSYRQMCPPCWRIINCHWRVIYEWRVTTDKDQ